MQTPKGESFHCINDELQCHFPLTNYDAIFLWQTTMPFSFWDCKAFFLWQATMHFSSGKLQGPFPLANYKALFIWQMAMSFALADYNVLFLWNTTMSFPIETKSHFPLRQQCLFLWQITKEGGGLPIQAFFLGCSQRPHFSDHPNIFRRPSLFFKVNNHVCLNGPSKTPFQGANIQLLTTCLKWPTLY